MRTNKALGYDIQKTKEIDKTLSKFSESLMSNSKWIRLIEQIINNADDVKKILFKKIQSDKIGELYLNSESIFEFDYWQTGFEGNNSFYDWLEYREIEYLLFPKTIDSQRNQDLDKIYALIKQVGEFGLELSDEELKLICYK
ncbi:MULTISPECIES: hypothetical protein [Chryseobacterium]|uniref:Uncharacterized protein n=1 Tax=Chryseobacterium taihuense TaxID=1141221 RepID=A0A1G9N021_9FLAO|nr:MULTISPECIES: hypothetical protein [Chryseobacterium]QQV03478.1 hypothetical protein I6I61_03800 [Chryseobacterium sp. FDAARGOS 1104]SDL79880.1 hypothetical protein SAMN05216273_106148 [Chryseobacterium taihuense]VFB03195.1 Uncharacterised protein [Chryseobacterium taihuense]